jgi:hypothetical protein
MGLALTIEKMSGHSGAFALALFWLFATTDIGAILVAADNLLFESSDWFCLTFCHFQVSLGSVQGNKGRTPAGWPTVASCHRVAGTPVS